MSGREFTKNVKNCSDELTSMSAESEATYIGLS